MESITYLGETLWPWHLGKFAIILAFVSSLFATISFYKAVSAQTQPGGWNKLGKIGFWIHGISVFTTIGLLFYILISHKYEYQYAWDHVSNDLPMKYIFSAFWEGQEGSFLLWMFWHVVLGFIILYTSKKWVSSVMSVLSSVQFFITSMILGLYIPTGSGEVKIGSNPFVLIRDVFDAPIFNNANYLEMIEGSGLNPLLQNYWMTIHPPVLFLGFAAVTIPFCYAIAGLIQSEHKAWLKPALRWALFASFSLGAGVLMGGAWAYEALSFGGYWAWDPVENTSLVPWLILVAGIHTNLVANKTGYSIRITYAFYITSFILILYSTFLTRSGILGDTSVHAFTEMGLENQLILFIGFYIVSSLVLFVVKYKKIPAPQKEEHLLTREFWMFIGSIVLFFSALLITISTSLPVMNSFIRWVYDPDYIGMVIQDPVSHYNKYQLWIAVFISGLSVLATFFRYKMPSHFDIQKKWLKYILIVLVVSLIASILLYSSFRNSSWQVAVLLCAGIFAILAHFTYLLFFIRSQLKLSASIFSHAGFGILILGILFSGLNSSYISTNPFAQKGLIPDEALGQNITLIKNAEFYTNNYWITYQKDSLVGNLRKFQIDFVKVDENNQPIENFSLFPNAVYSNDFSKISAWNPDTKHYLHKDIFTNISGYPRHLLDIEEARAMEDSLIFDHFDISLHETISIDSITILVKSIEFNPFGEGVFQNSELTLVSDIEIHSKFLDSTFQAKPALGLQDGYVVQFPHTIDALGIRIKLDESYFGQMFTQEEELNYEQIHLREGETKEWSGYSVYLEGFERDPQHQNYKKQEGDIGVSGILHFQSISTGQSFQLKPLYIIRNSQQYSIKDYIASEGIHGRFSNIDPNKELMEFRLARDNRNTSTIPLLIAQNVPRSDIITLEAKIFPGINLVWLGSILMLFGLIFALINKRTSPA